MFGKLTKFHTRLKKLRMEKTGRRISKQISTAEEELASKLQMVEAEILPLRWGFLSFILGNTSYRELSDALQTVVDQKLEKSALYPGEAAHPETVTPPAQPTIDHSVAEGLGSVESLRQSIAAWSPTPASSPESPPSSLVYGGIHLLRMLVLLPDIFAHMDFQPEQADLVKSLSTNLQKFLVDEAGQFVKATKYQ